MTNIDIFIVIFWSLIILAIGIGAGIKSTFDDFWVNSRHTSTMLLVFTIVATQIGGGTILGIASSSYSSGTGFGLVAVFSTFTGFLAIAWLAPKIKNFGNRRNAITLPEILGEKYGRSAQFSAGLIIIFAYLSMLGGQLLATSIIVQVWSGFSFKIALLIACGGVIAYSAFAGLKGDIATDIFHFWIMSIILFAILLPLIFINEPVLNILENLPVKVWSPVTFGGYTYLIAGISFGVIIPIVSMELWMRIFAAQNESNARKAYIWSAFLILPFYIFPLFLGLLSINIIPNVKNPDFILIENLFKYLPSGLLGFGVAGLFAVLISTANTIIVVLGATFYRDILGRSTENTSQNLKISRIITLIIGIIGTLFSFLIPNIVQLVLNAFFMIAILFPALLALAIWKNVTPLGGKLSIILGGITTLIFLPSMPTQAFVPGLIIAILALIIGSLFKKKMKNV